MKYEYFCIAASASKELKYVLFPKTHKNNPLLSSFFFDSNQISLEIFGNVISLSELEEFLGSFSLFSAYCATANLGRKTVHDK